MASEKFEFEKAMNELSEIVSKLENGDVSLTENFVIGRTTEIFGQKIYDDIGTQKRGGQPAPPLEGKDKAAGQYGTFHSGTVYKSA